MSTTPNPKPTKNLTWWDSTQDFFSHILDLRDGLDRKGTVDKIHKNIETKGANIWLLISAIFIASIGLDTNSPAVIIGAMLISPLMSPILGMGLSIGINDRKTLWLSLRHFLIAIAVSLITSIIYFKITPFGTLTSEIAARTSPTVLDVMVAFFGGIAGVVAVSRKDLINAVPGVAIATALLPPLCVTGFGLANGNWEVAWGSFYLFFLNSTFVSLATYIIVRILNFPFKVYVNKEERQRSAILMVLVATLLIIPSFFKLTEILTKSNQNRNVERYMAEAFDEETMQVVDWEFEDTDTTDLLKVTLVADKYLPEDSLEKYRELLHNSNYGLPEQCDLKVIQLKDPPKNTDKTTLEIQQIKAEVGDIKTKYDERLNVLQTKVDVIKKDSIPINNIVTEVKILFPELEKIAFSKAVESDLNLDIDTIDLLLLDWDETALKKAKKNKEDVENTLEEWMETKLNNKDFRVVEY